MSMTRPAKSLEVSQTRCHNAASVLSLECLTSRSFVIPRSRSTSWSRYRAWDPYRTQRVTLGSPLRRQRTAVGAGQAGSASHTGRGTQAPRQPPGQSERKWGSRQCGTQCKRAGVAVPSADLPAVQRLHASPLPREAKDLDRVSTRPGSAEVRGLVLRGHGGPAFVDVAAEVEAPLRGRSARREEHVRALRLVRAGLILVRHELPETVTVDVRMNPVEMEQVLYFTLFREKRVRFFGLNCC